MIHRRSLGWILLFAVLFCPLVAGAIGFQPVSPEELAMTSEPNAPGAAAVILYRQVDRDDNGRTTHEDNYFRIKILKEEGRKYADVEIQFSKTSQDVVNIKARTIHPDGSVANFDGKAYEKTIVKGKDIKYLAKTFTLPDVQPGSIIEYSYTVDYVDQYIFDSHWIVSSELFTRHAKFSLKPYSSYYQQFRLRWSGQGVKDGPAQGPDQIVRMEVNNLPAFETEDHMPPQNEMKSRVDFIYVNALVVDSDPTKFWKGIDKELNSHVESFINKRKAMEQAVSQIVSPNDSPEEKAQKIYTRVQQLRNTTYEVAKTEEERKRNKEKEIKNVEDVWKNGYGDRFELTWLYLALARAAGLDAYGMLVSDRSNYFLDLKTMNDRKLDNNVVMLHFKEKDVWCDPGAAFTPYGLLPWYETGVHGLRLDKEGGQWIDTTLPDSAVSQSVRKANLKLDSETGALEGKLTVTYTGLEAVTRRVEERNEDDMARKKLLEDEVRELVPAAVEVELVNKPDWNSPSSPLVAEFDLKIPGWASQAGRRVMLSVGLFSAPEKHIFDHAHRIHPIYYKFPSTEVDDVTIELPEEWNVSSVPPAINEVQKIIGYALKIESTGHAVHLSRTFRNDIFMIEPKYYPALQSFYHGVRTSDEQEIVLLPGSTTASN